MRHCAVMLLAAALLLSCASSPRADASRPIPTVPLSLTDVIRQEMSTPGLRHALWGVRIEEEDGTVLADINSHTLMIPASNRKIFVAGLVNDCLGPAATLPTQLWLDGTVDGSILHGNVVIRGGGDPSLGGRYESDRSERLLPFVTALRRRGITRVEGSVVADVSLYSRETIPSGWKTGYLGASYAAPVDAIAFNENVVGVLATSRGCGQSSVTTDPPFGPSDSSLVCGTSDSVTMTTDALNRAHVSGTTAGEPFPRNFDDTIAVTDAGLFAAQALQTILEDTGVTFDRQPRTSATPQPWREKIAEIDSPPIYQLLTTVLKNSQNLYAEMLYRDSVAGTGPISYADARAEERRFLVDVVGIDPAEFDFDDGSGLSVQDLVTPAAVVTMFRYLDTSPRGSLFRTLLPSPGDEGTLRRRLLPLKGRLFGKTGSILGVNALSGYAIGSSGKKRYFSIILNHHLADGDEALASIDRIALRLADF